MPRVDATGGDVELIDGQVFNSRGKPRPAGRRVVQPELDSQGILVDRQAAHEVEAAVHALRTGDAPRSRRGTAARRLRGAPWATPGRRSAWPSTVRRKPRKIRCRSAGHEPHGRIEQPPSPRPHADFIIGGRSASELFPSSEPPSSRGGNRPRFGRVADAQRRLGPIRLVETRVVLRARVRFQLQPDLPPGKTAQIGFARFPTLGGRVPFEDDLAQLTRGGVPGATRTRNVTPSPFPWA